MQNKLILAMLLVLSFNTFAQTEVKPYSEDNRNIVVTADKNTFTLHLKSNPTTGYSWFLREYDANLLAPKKRTYVPAGKKLIGGGGSETWTFAVKQAGFVVPQQTTFRMMYARPWEDVSKASQVIFHVSTAS
jgi:inhibitor of cysteine peptidase